MSCESCTKMKAVNRCFTNMDMGTYSETETNVDVYAENLGTGKIHRLRVTTGASGEMTLTPQSQIFMPNVTYRIWTTASPSDSFEDRVQWTLPDGTTTVTCVLVKMKSIEFGGDDMYPDTNVGLIAA